MKIRGKTVKKVPRRGKTVKVTKTVRVKEPKPQQKATILDVVNRMLNRKTETKFIGQWITTNAVQTGVSPFPGAYFQNVVQNLGAGGTGGGAQYWNPALPAMIQGLTDINRIGDRIEPTSLKVKLNLRLAQQLITADPDVFGAQARPLDVTAYIFYGLVKSMKTYQNSVTLQDSRLAVSGQSEAVTAMSRLLDVGDTTFTTFDGSQQLAQLPLSHYVQMKVKKVHLRQASGWINTNANNGSATPNGDSQNTIRKEVTLSFKLPSKLAYGASTSIYPDNYAPVFAVGYVYNDAAASTNQAVPVFGQGAIEYTAFSSLYFKDHQ